MKNMKIRNKFLLTFTLIIVFFLVNITMGIISLHLIADSFITFYNGPYRSTYSAEKMCKEMQSAQKNLALSILLEDPGEIEEHAAQCEADFAALSADIASLKKTYTNSDGQQSLINLENELNASNELLKTALGLSRSLQWQEAASLYERQLKPTLEKAEQILDQINSGADVDASGFFAAAMGTKSRASVITILLSVLTLFIMVFLALRLTKNFVGPIYEIEAATKRIATGDLEAHITYQSRDELGELAESTRDMVHNFRRYIRDLSTALSEIAGGNFDVSVQGEFLGEFSQLKESTETITKSVSGTLRQISTAAGQVSIGSEQVSGSAQSLSQGATEQASAVEELAATIDEISSQIRNNAGNSAEASNKASSVGARMAESNQQMQEMMDAMEKISSSSNEIGKIIKTIEDIAFQTNILALNAAVEAARAGAAGKGFAVVADEVRSLAGKSAEASQNTAVLIEGSIRAVERGAQLADATARSLTEAVQGAAEVAQTIEKISSASEEQATSVSQIMLGIDQIAAVVQTNSATAEESAAASEQLSQQAHMLDGLVRQFHLKGEQARQAALTSGQI